MSGNQNGTNPILAMLYEAYTSEHQTEYEGIKAAFQSLYESMNAMTLQDMDRVIYPVCTLCREHEKQGFIDGIKVGVQLTRELDDAFKFADPFEGESCKRFKETKIPY